MRRSLYQSHNFYNYYSDKYALVEEMFEDYMNEALADYYALQKENNKEKDDIKDITTCLPPS